MDYRRIRQNQVMREAEGYLELAMVLADRWPLSAETRNPLAKRALQLLSGLRSVTARRAHWYFLKGQAYRTLERYHDAIKPLEKAADLDSGSISTWLALGWCHKRCGRLDKAIEALEAALEVSDGEAIVHYNLACYWSLADNVKLAVMYLSRALDIDPEYRDLIPGERDFDRIRHLPEFRALTTVIV